MPAVEELEPPIVSFRFELSSLGRPEEEYS
jgi:hypothetical protein